MLGHREPVHKITFDACRMAGFLDSLPNRPDVVVSGCETHVCVLQTTLGLLAARRRVYLMRDAVGKETAICRLECHRAEIVTTDMELFEWLGTAEDSRLRRIIELVR